MSEKLNENPVEKKIELNPITVKPDTDELAEATGDELGQVEGGNGIGTRSGDLSRFFKRH